MILSFLLAQLQEIARVAIESIRDNESIVKVSYEEFVKSPVKAVRKLLGNK